MKTKSLSEWMSNEFSGSDLPDERLGRRLKNVATQLAMAPSLPINRAHQDWASTKAAYRFFSNPKVSYEAILDSHLRQTQTRAADCNKIIAIEDTSVLRYYNRPSIKGLGYVGTGKYGKDLEGLHLHVTLALTEGGLPLGLLDEFIWPRKIRHLKSYKKNCTPLKKKESYRWVRSLEKADKFLPESEIILVCDREADIYELFEKAVDLNATAIVRLREDRAIYDDENEEYMRISEKVASSPIKGHLTVEVQALKNRKARKARLEVRYCPVTFTARRRLAKLAFAKNRHDLDLFIVEVKEKTWRRRKDFLHWTLITTEPVTNLAQAKQIVAYYKMRWMVELYFKILKTSCRIEECRLNHADKLKNYIAVMSVIAWRILWMTYAKRVQPQSCCDTVLSDPEWKALWLLHNRKKILSEEMQNVLPNHPPETVDAILWMAQLGGFMARASDGEPGLINIWRGWLNLIPAAQVLELLEKEKPTPRKRCG